MAENAHPGAVGRPKWYDTPSGDGFRWNRDGVLEVLELRCRAILAGAMSERSSDVHPWEPSDWDLVASAVARTCALFVEAQATVSDGIYGLPSLAFDVLYDGRPYYKRHFNGEVDARATAAATIQLTATGRDGQHVGITILLRWKSEDAWFLQQFKTFIVTELRFQLLVPSTQLEPYARPRLYGNAPLDYSERIWDFRVRFTDFLVRFLWCHRRQDIPQVAVTPFSVFFLQPRLPPAIAKPEAVRSGLFGYGYMLDSGQQAFLQGMVDSSGRSAIEILNAHWVHFPGGVCSQVYLQATPTDPHDADPYIEMSPPELRRVEAQILGGSTLMEIPIYAGAWGHDASAPDGPEAILCVCLKKPSVAEETSLLPQPEFATSTRAAIDKATSRPGGSHYRQGESQLVRELGQKLVARYALPRTMRSVRTSRIVGQCEAIRKLSAAIDQAAKRDVIVVIHGESGAGKELVAREVQARSRRKDGPLITFNCAQLGEGVMESELFGHEKGAFTGAIADRRGYIEVAHKGTLFIDEIADMPLGMQVKLLRVLEDGVLQRMGSTNPIQVDVRVIVASAKDLFQEVQAQRFREDLFNRLFSVVIEVPPLRERREDIPLLVRHFQADYSSKQGVSCNVDADALELLVTTDYTWPANVRELSRFLERGFVATDEHLTRTWVEEELGRLTRMRAQAQSG